MKFLSLFAFLAMVIASSARGADAADASVSVNAKAVCGGTSRNGKTSVDTRFLRIELENRSDHELVGLKVEWAIYGKDIQKHSKKVDERGARTVTLPANGRLVMESESARFTETEGGSKSIGKGKSKRKVGTPDTGRCYAGYVVSVKLNGKVIAEDATSGLGR